MDSSQRCLPATLPPSSRAARRISSARIPMAALPVEPTPEEIEAAVAKLEDAYLRDKQTVRCRGKR